MTSSGASERVTTTPGPVRGVRPAGSSSAVDLALVAAHVVVVDLVGEVADLLGQLGDPLLERGGAVGLGVGERGQVVVPPRPQVGALAGLRADHEQPPADQHHSRRRQPPAGPAGQRAAGDRSRFGLVVHVD